MNKRGLAGIVTTVLLIIIAIALVVIIWYPISKVVNQGEDINKTISELTNLQELTKSDKKETSNGYDPIGSLEGHNFQFSFENDGFLRELKWTQDNGNNWKSVSSTEQDSPSWRKLYIHSRTGNDGTDEGWSYTLPNGNSITESHTQIIYSKISEDEDQVKINAESQSIKIGDEFTFKDDTIFLKVKIKNKLNEKIDISLPIYFGGLDLDDSSRRKLSAKDGGRISEFVADGGGNIASSSYPEDIRSYSPLHVLWDNSFTISQQYLIKLELPTNVQFMEKIADRNKERLKSVIKTELSSQEEKSFLIAFKLSSSGNWQDSLNPYKEWFYANYGNTPSYCPTSAAAFGHAGNLALNPDRYDELTNRWIPGTKISDLYIDKGTLDMAEQLELQNYGIWASALWPGHISDECYNDLINNGNIGLTCSFAANSELFDPNLDVGSDSSKLTDFANTYKEKDVNLFWYMRSCSNIYNAAVLPDGSFVKGQYVKVIDLRDSNLAQVQFDKFEFFADHGVKNFYIDYISCPGEEEFLKFIREELIRINGEESFLLREGVRDRVSLLWPQLNVLKLGDTDHSVLMFWLLPDASYYEGKIGGGGFLEDSEIDDILVMGYQPIIDNALVSERSSRLPTWKDWMCKAYQNQISRYNSYGQNIGCTPPRKPSYC